MRVLFKRHFLISVQFEKNRREIRWKYTKKCGKKFLPFTSVLTYGRILGIHFKNPARIDNALPLLLTRNIHEVCTYFISHKFANLPVHGIFSNGHLEVVS